MDIDGLGKDSSDMVGFFSDPAVISGEVTEARAPRSSRTRVPSRRAVALPGGLTLPTATMCFAFFITLGYTPTH